CFLLRLGPRREHSGPSPTHVSSLGNCRGVVLARVTLHNARKRLPAPRKWIYETPASYPQGKQDEKQHFSKSSIDNFDGLHSAFVYFIENAQVGLPYGKRCLDRDMPRIARAQPGRKRPGRVRQRGEIIFWKSPSAGYRRTERRQRLLERNRSDRLPDESAFRSAPRARESSLRQPQYDYRDRSEAAGHFATCNFLRFGLRPFVKGLRR